MKKKLRRLKKAVRSVTFAGSEQSFEAGITKDLHGVFVSVPHHIVGDVASSEVTILHTATRGPYELHTIVADQMIKLPEFADIVGRMVCVFPKVHISNLDSFSVEAVTVVTPFVGLARPRFSPIKTDPKELTQRIHRNQPVTLHPELCDPIKHQNWASRPRWNVRDGLNFYGMATTMPVCGKGLEALEAVRDRIEALRILLALLNGGRRVDISKVEVHIVGISSPIDVLFPTKTLDVLQFGLDIYFRNRLICHGGLRTMGMKRVKKWVEWHSRFRNKAILDRWLFSKDPLNSISVIEGVGRAMLRDEGFEKNVYLEKAVGKVLGAFDLADVVSNGHVKALNEVNKKLAKHIGDLRKEEDSEYRRDAGPLSALASFLVGYALLRWAIGELPPIWDDAWRKEVENAARQVSPS